MKSVASKCIAVACLSLVGYVGASPLDNVETKDLKKAELSLIQEIKERTCQVFDEAQISHYAHSEEKKASDKMAVASNIGKLIGIKHAIDVMVKERKASPGYNDQAYVEIKNLKVHSAKRTNEDKFENAFTSGVTITRGDVLKPSVKSHSTDTPLAYRITYCDTGIVRIQGEEVMDGGIVSFDVNGGDADYNVTGTVTISKKGWN